MSWKWQLECGCHPPYFDVVVKPEIKSVVFHVLPQAGCTESADDMNKLSAWNKTAFAINKFFIHKKLIPPPHTAGYNLP